MAAAMKSAPATNARAELAKPASPKLMAADVPRMTLGSLTDGAVPNRTAMSVVIMMALASYETASVTQTMTAKTRMANMRWPATGRSAGVGSANTATNAAIPRIKARGNFVAAGAEAAAGAVGCPDMGGLYVLTRGLQTIAPLPRTDTL